LSLDPRKLNRRFQLRSFFGLPPQDSLPLSARMAYGDGPSEIVNPEPQKDYNDKDEAKGGAQFIGLGGKPGPGI
jgi:hypothetical protein